MVLINKCVRKKLPSSRLFKMLYHRRGKLYKSHLLCISLQDISRKVSHLVSTIPRSKKAHNSAIISEVTLNAILLLTACDPTPDSVVMIT